MRERARRCRQIAAMAPTSRWWKCRPAAGARPIVAEIYGPDAEAAPGGPGRALQLCSRPDRDMVDVDDSSITDAPRTLLLVDRRTAALLGVPQQAIVTTLRAGLAGNDAAYLHDQSKYPPPPRCNWRRRCTATCRRCCNWVCRISGAWCRSANW